MLDSIYYYFASEATFFSEVFCIFGDSTLTFWLSSLFLAVTNYLSSKGIFYLDSLIFDASIFYNLPFPSAVAEKLSSFISSDFFFVWISC